MLRSCASVLLCCLPSFFFVLNAQNAAFLDIDVNARTAGMAGAGSVARNNPMALYANSAAALAGDMVAGGALSAGPWQKGFRATDVVYGGTAIYRPGGRNLVSAGFRYIQAPKMSVMDEYGHCGGMMRPEDLAIDAGYGRLFGKSWAVSMNAGWVRSSLGYGGNVSDAMVFGLHGAYLGAFADESRGNWTAGLSVKGMGVCISGEKHDMPLDIVAAGNVELLFGESHSLSFSADLDIRVIPSACLGFAAGAEYTFLRHGVLRAGYCASFAGVSDGISTDMTNVFMGFASAGCGVIFGPFRCDAAWRFAGDRDNPLNNSAVFSVSLMF